MRWMEAKIQDAYGEIRRSSRRKEKTPVWKGWCKAVAAAALAVVIPVTGYAAAKQFGLLDFLEKSGMENEAIVIQMAADTTVEEAQTFSNSYVDYTIQEALCDGEILYMVVKAQPTQETYLLVPQYCTEEDDAGSWLDLPEASGQTVGEYAAAQGQEIVWGGIALFQGEELVSGSIDEQHMEDGSVVYCITGENPFEAEAGTLNCVGTAYTKGASAAERAEGTCSLSWLSDSVTRSYCMEDNKMEQDLGIVMEQIEVLETELGIYVTLTYRAGEAEGAEDAGFMTGLVFSFRDDAGETLTSMPYYAGTGTITNEDGTYTRTMAYQKPETEQNSFQMMVEELESGVSYGPYSVVAD